MFAASLAGWACGADDRAPEPDAKAEAPLDAAAGGEPFVDTIVCEDPAHGVPSLRFKPMPSDPPGTLHFAMQRPDLGDQIAETYAGGIACVGQEIDGSVIPRLSCSRTVCTLQGALVTCEDGDFDQQIEIRLTTAPSAGLIVIRVHNPFLAPFYGGMTSFQARVDPATCARSSAGCAHAVCTAGPKLENGCNGCATVVCDADAFCCEDNWDSACVAEAEDLCDACGD